MINLSIKMTEVFGVENWEVVLIMMRRDDQPSIEAATKHPTADEIDDWHDYQVMKKKKKEEAIGEWRKSGSLFAENETQPPVPSDSGYGGSRRPSSAV